MANVTSRAELIQYCYRALGAPLININMTEDQADDIVENAIEFFREYYFDGIERLYYKHLITQTDFDNKYITLPDNILGVTKVFPALSGQTQPYIFDVQYQMRMNDIQSLLGTNMIYYSQMQGHLALLDYMLSTAKQFRWNRLTAKLYIDQDWSIKDKVGEYLLIECYGSIDPDVSTKFWNERLFKKYCVALFKQQWGQNVGKYSGITLPGGVTLDGDAWYDKGKQEADDIEEHIMTMLSPLEMNIG